MKPRASQRGAALLIVLASLLLIAGYSWLQQVNASHPSRDSELHARLLRAKEALIARAVTDANRPGSLPCPDLLTDDNGLANHPNDGKADNLTRNDCPSYVGWLPWVTLDLPELTDLSGNRLWYVLSRNLRDDDTAQPINSDTPATLTLDGRGDLVALIIAPGAAVNGQNRPTFRPADYLDGVNASSASHFSSGPTGDQFNDIILPLSRQELMAAVKKRVAGELRACLEQHATASANRWQEYPWPAPFTSSNGRGKAGSLFGQVAATQPGSGPQVLLAASSEDLQTTRNRLISASNLNEQLAALQTINDSLAYAKTLYDRVYSNAKDLALTAKTSQLNFSDLNSTLIAANSNGRISVTERKTIQADSASDQTQLASLLSQLSDAGIDVFPDELSLHQLTLRSKIDLAGSSPSASSLGQLKDAGNALLGLFSNSHTSNTDLAISLNNALARSAEAAISAQQASAAPNDAALLSQALHSARNLVAANEQLQTTIASNRPNPFPGAITSPNLADNLTLESLRSDNSRFNSQLNTFNTIVTRTQAEMVPYAENLRLAAVDLQFWAEIINRQASNIATLARKAPEASKTQSNANSAYTLADQALTSINKSGGSLQKLQEALDSPGNSSKQSAANSALNDTLAQVDRLLPATASLGQNLHSSTAEAFPVLWYGSRCAFLQPGSDNTSWWFANQWNNTVFYQISSRLRASSGQLTVDGRGNLHSVVITAGQALATQDRLNKRSASYFEGNNADPSRDGDATAPGRQFSTRPTSATFNDRLAF